MTPEQAELWQKIERNTAELKESLLWQQANNMVAVADPELTAAFEQEEVETENVARLIGIYYRTLMEEGVPEVLVFSLVNDFQNYQLSMLARGVE